MEFEQRYFGEGRDAAARQELEGDMHDAVVAEGRRGIRLEYAGDFERESLLLADGADGIERAAREEVGLIAIERVDPALAHLPRQGFWGKRSGQRLKRLVADGYEAARFGASAKFPDQVDDDAGGDQKRTEPPWRLQ
jgi:hypothetical protein